MPAPQRNPQNPPPTRPNHESPPFTPQTPKQMHKGLFTEVLMDFVWSDRCTPRRRRTLFVSFVSTFLRITANRRKFPRIPTNWHKFPTFIRALAEARS
jgi:hypothetical protein